MKIILDTNFLMIPIQFKVDIFSEFERLMEGQYELWIMEGTERELKKVAKNKGKKGIPARLALKIIKKNNIKVLKSKKDHVDDAIVEIADKNTIVATNDKKLRQQLKDKNVKIIYLRGKKYLELM